MEKLDKKDYFNIFWVIIVYLGIALTITHGEFVFGSKIDWGFQHFVFPDYFRQLFYQTGNLFPDFAPNIGGGQNIYYFAYYGLLSPVILISYLFPFIPMGIYIVLSTLLLGILSIILLYKFLKNNGFDKDLCLVLSLLFVCASPVLFHAHRHIMFIDYMSFLIMGLIGVQKYFKENKRILLIISIFLMIMTSYLYSVGGLVCLTVFAIYEYLKREKISLKSFTFTGLKYAGLVFIGICMSLTILLPVMYALSNGRAESVIKVGLSSVFKINLNLDYLLYGSYSLGLTGISLISAIYLIFNKKKQVKFLGICLSLMIVTPLIVYLLNGGLYLDGKALIPFLPLFILAIGIFLRDFTYGNVNYKVLFVVILITIIWALCLKEDIGYLYIFDIFIVSICLMLYVKFKKEWIIYIPLMVFAVLVSLSSNLGDELISNDDYSRQNDSRLSEIIEDIARNDKDYYRLAVNLSASSQMVNRIYNINQRVSTIYSSTYNTNYNRFFYYFNNNMASRNMFITNETKNTLFETLMGVKYLVTDKAAPLGYKLYKNYGEYQVYINKYTLPLGYSSSNLISKKDFNKLEFPDDIYALISRVVSDKTTDKYISPFKKIDLDLMNSEKNNIDIVSEGDGYKVNVLSEEGGTLRIKLDESVKNKFYLPRFNMKNPQSCSKGDTVIKVNGINNKLTCKQWKYFNNNYTFDYTLSSTKSFRYLNITFSKGTHYIDKVLLYSLDYDDIKNIVGTVDKFNISQYKGDNIKGNINVTNDGYFVLTLPYDKGFKVKLDNKEISYEKINEGFIGFKINKGSHNIEVSFEAPFALAGKICSLFGFVLLILVYVYEKKYQRN